MKRGLFLVLIMVVVLGLSIFPLEKASFQGSQVFAQPSCDWPTVHHDVARSGHSPCEVRPPFTEIWNKVWEGEMMSTRMEAIVADGKVFVGTYAGKMHALDAGTGDELWTFTTDNQAGIAHSPAVSANNLVFGTVDGKIYGLDADTANKFWDFSAHGPGGFLTSPAIYNGIVYMGSKDGYFYAVNLTDGTLKWDYEVGEMILNTAAIKDNVVYFGAEDMHAYALDADTGALIWKSDKFYGMSMRDYYPVIAGDVVFFTTNPAYEFFTITHPENYFLRDTGGGSGEQQAILDYLAANPHHKVFYALRRSDGQEKFQAPVFYQAGCQGVMTPPTVLADGTVMLNYRSYDSVYQRTYHYDLSGGMYTEYRAIGSINLDTGAIEQFQHAYGNTQERWTTGWWSQGDETQILSSGGNILYNTHKGNPAGMDLSNGTMFPLHPGPDKDSWGGYVTPTWAGNEWNGPARGSIAIVGNRFYWISGSRMIAVQGQ